MAKKTPNASSGATNWSTYLLPAPVYDGLPSIAIGLESGPHELIERKTSVVISCYNEYDNIQLMYQRLRAVLQALASWYEIIFVNNGSYDRSAELFDALAAADPHVRVLTLSRNFGAQGAYTSGIEYASEDGVICLDGDIQDPPELIPALVQKWLEGYGVVYGIRVRHKGSLPRRIGYKLFYRLFPCGRAGGRRQAGRQRGSGRRLAGLAGLAGLARSARRGRGGCGRGQAADGRGVGESVVVHALVILVGADDAADVVASVGLQREAAGPEAGGLRE
ncbi:MAG TPA: glycosyltransferase family 2 protein [Ktedonobacterales bacterium]